MINAVDELIYYYKKFPLERVPRAHPVCPLCVQYCDNSGGYFDTDKCSDQCPWIRFEGRKCYHTLNNFHRQITSERLERLNRWKEEYRRINEGFTADRFQQPASSGI